jgi:hypothetical protein
MRAGGAGDCRPHLRKSQQKRALAGRVATTEGRPRSLFPQSDSSRLQCTTIPTFVAIFRGQAISCGLLRLRRAFGDRLAGCPDLGAQQ